jgi:OOP family OmpA-OmpF porin
VAAPPPPPPADSDGDGVIDDRDKCPGTPRGVAVDRDGCPKDSDGDGIIDDRDKCPGTPKGAAVDTTGCPVDSDGDGVPDYLDKCPDTRKGVPVDKDGCPLPEKISISLLVEFDTDKADIRPKYHDEIARVGDFMKKYSETTAVIEGHTDNMGGKAYNERLSQRRADAVRKYLIDKFGIAASRLTAKGYGFAKPVADNKTAEGRQKNRRIEASITTVAVKK